MMSPAKGFSGLHVRGVRYLAAAVAVLAIAVTGCSVGAFGGAYTMPLPGGADLGDHPYRVTAEFSDVLDLVPQASVKVNDVAVGKVEKIDLARDNKTAVVSLAVNGAVRLPGNAMAGLKQSSLLGEKYVELRAPTSQQAQGQLTDGAVIPLARTNRNPEIEEVLGALSLLLNGGGIGQLQNIVKELNSALAGNEAQIRSFLSTMDALVADLDRQKGNIVKAIDAINRLSGTLVAQRANIVTTLDDLASGLQVITAQRGQLVDMLRALDNLSTVAVDTVNKSRDDIVADLKALSPTLRKLGETGTKLPVALQYLVTYPFSDYAANAVKGDYFNSDIRFDLDLSELLTTLGSSSQPVITLPSSPGTDKSPAPGLPAPTFPLPSLPVPSIQPGGGNPAPSTGVSGLLGMLLGGGR